jgi:hypothetical protein
MRGTLIPKSFELRADRGARFWVHPNVTEHFSEYLTRFGVSPTDPVRNQLMLTDFISAVNMAVNRGIRYGEIMNVGRWEIGVDVRIGNELPTIYHARPVR